MRALASQIVQLVAQRSTASSLTYQLCNLTTCVQVKKYKTFSITRLNRLG